MPRAQVGGALYYVFLFFTFFAEGSQRCPNSGLCERVFVRIVIQYVLPHCSSFSRIGMTTHSRNRKCKTFLGHALGNINPRPCPLPLEKHQFSHRFSRFLGNHKRARSDLWTARNHNEGVVDFARIFTVFVEFRVLAQIVVHGRRARYNTRYVDFPMIFKVFGKP